MPISEPRIDVLLPTYNSDSFLPEAIASIQAQTIHNIRIIVVDDGSTDNTAALLAAAAARDPRIHVITQPNAGIVAALNAGLAACTAPIIARHDADDLSDPTRLEKQLAYLDQNKSCVAVSSLARHIDAAGVALGTITTLKVPKSADDSSLPALEPYLLHPMLMLRRMPLERVGGYRYVYNSEDTDLYWRLHEKADLHIIPEPLGSYRLHAASLTSASIVSGRQTSVWSQLSALSAQRRRLDREDLSFDPVFMAEMRRQVSFEDIYKTASRGLTDAEKIWLASASAAKLMELCYYRPFEPERADIRFIRKAVAADTAIKQRKGYAGLEEGIMSAGIRLLIAKRPRDALALVDRRSWPKLVARTAFRVGIPKNLKGLLKRPRGGRVVMLA